MSVSSVDSLESIQEKLGSGQARSESTLAMFHPHDCRMVMWHMATFRKETLLPRTETEEHMARLENKHSESLDCSLDPETFLQHP